MSKIILVISLLISCQVSYTQNRNITGRVTDNPATQWKMYQYWQARIMGTKTDKDGYYSFLFPQIPRQLYFLLLAIKPKKEFPEKILFSTFK